MLKNVVRQPRAEEIGLINKHFAKKELTAQEVYAFDIDAADDYTLTAFFSYLGTDMIEAFHQDVMARHVSQDAELIGFLFGHDTSKIPSGTLFQSELVQVAEGDAKLTSFRPSVYMVKNLKTAEISTDDYIKALESGHTEAVSVAFQAGSFICSICGDDIRTLNCPHVPARWYNIAPEGEPPVNKLCTYTVHQGSVKKRNLIELSGVYAGAMPGKRVKKEFMVPENGKLEIKDGKVVNSEGQTVVSVNIKDFKETDVLRFNFQFDGSIEKAGETEMSEEIKSILEKLKKAEDERLALQKSLEDLQAKHDSLKSLLDKTQANLEASRVDLEKEKTSHKATVKNLSLSEADKTDLQQGLDAEKEKVEKLSAELQEKATIADAFVVHLKERCAKLSIAINGMNHNKKLFDKEIAVLSVDELKVKIEGLEKQLTQSIPTGKQTEHTLETVNFGKDAPNTVNKESEANRNPELFKTN